MKEKIILFLKGIVLGISFLIPGVSGGTLAVTMGLYEDLIEAISHFYQGKENFKKYFMFVLPIGLGVVASVVIFARIIKYGLEHQPIITLLFFIGLILGGLPSLFKKVNLKKLNVKDVICILIGIGILFGISLLNPSGNVSLKLSLFGIIKLILVGMLASATMVVPGISGSFMLMTIGYYEPVLGVVTEVTKLTNLSHNILILIPFFIGIVFGIIFIAKLIEYSLKYYERITYYLIIGFVLASIYQVASTLLDYTFTISNSLIGFVVMMAGAFAIYKFFGEK